MSTSSNYRPGGPIPPTRFLPTFLALFALGLLGVLSLIPTVLDTVDTLPPELAELPEPLLVLVSLANALILLAIAVAVGTLLAHRVGLRSLVADKVRTGTAIWPRLRPHIGLAVVLGVLFLVIVLAIDLLVAPFTDVETLGIEAPNLAGVVSALVVGVLYGGITEELLLRWAVMSLFVWAGWRTVQRGQGEPGRGLAWTAIVLAALLFGIGHLPALAGIAPLTPLLVIRTVLLNALGGLVFGWLYWRRSLEVAMVSHATFHVALFVVNVVMLALGVGAA